MPWTCFNALEICMNWKSPELFSQKMWNLTPPCQLCLCVHLSFKMWDGEPNILSLCLLWPEPGQQDIWVSREEWGPGQPMLGHIDFAQAHANLPHTARTHSIRDGRRWRTSARISQCRPTLKTDPGLGRAAGQGSSGWCALQKPINVLLGDMWRFKVLLQSDSPVSGHYKISHH